jgi:hypothetical protein
MFKTFATSGLARFWPVQPRRVTLGQHEVGLFNVTHSNDNLPGFRRPKDQRRIPTPTLVCHWINHDGRLECRWRIDASGNAPIGDFHEQGKTGRAFGPSPMQPRSRNLALAG